MAEIIWTASAIYDMDKIAGYIAVSNINAAVNLVTKIKTKIQRLELFPESGRIPNDLIIKSYREILIKPCRIFYQVKDDKVFIIRVIRQERDLRNYIIQELKADYAAVL